ncbi:T9SS type A sorting domain-containing protein [Flavivirga eckloniae]|uniref:Secretion system C-terminal sorting domain-containing protein n=1 Tax=Flavivirga eckloniae TaxID=1803846 RepID=A0A2K9PPD2_9FLAO|nr:T9SS type A sorting domain-containing protein [Flavivirga eckloniae]AUP78904.1 hypothetical protein C1H87_09400 [Flavivirga eckloniae]
MTYIKAITGAAFLLLSAGGILQAQESPTVTNGKAKGAGGTVSYSVGQVVCTTNTGLNGSLSQGVHQPYGMTLATDNGLIHLELMVYPNPTTNRLTLNVDNIEFSMLNFQLYDIHGNQLKSGWLENKTTTIIMEKLPTATYFLKVSDNKKTSKTFRIIKK